MYQTIIDTFIIELFVCFLIEKNELFGQEYFMLPYMLKYTIPQACPIIGYKGFNGKLCCRKKQYEVGKTFTENHVKVGMSGIHFCEIPMDVEVYYPFINTGNRFAIIWAWGDVMCDYDGNWCASHVKIVQELTPEEMMEHFVNRLRSCEKITLIDNRGSIQWVEEEECIAIRMNTGATGWYNKYGQLHRNHGPAAEFINGQKQWYQNSLLHRDDGPSVEFPNGHHHWYQHGKLHRDNGPAVVYTDGGTEWFKNGKIHQIET